jgi:competence protein ComFC
MKTISNLKKLTTFFADLIFPISCLVCGTDGTFLCPNCQDQLARIDNQLCIVCKKAAPFGKTHIDCVSKNTLDGIVSGLKYANPQVKKVVGTFKYEFISDLATPLAKILVESCKNLELGNYFETFTIIPVPLHKKRLNWRGFNQAELLGKALADEMNIPLDSSLISRDKFTKPQIDLSAEDRKKNISNAFGMESEASGKYLIVDDVVTTGSTLNEIAKLLKRQGASEVWAITLAHG